MTENTFPVYSADAIVNFYRTEILTGQEAKHFTKSDLTPVPKVTLVQMSSVDRNPAFDCGNNELFSAGVRKATEVTYYK